MPEPRLRPNEKPLTAAEFEDRKEKWAARQQEEELRQQRELQLRQEALDASRQEEQAEQLPEAKVSVRTDLLPSGPKMTPEQTALLPKMTGWHETYSDNVKPFKMALSQLMAVPGEPGLRSPRGLQVDVDRGRRAQQRPGSSTIARRRGGERRRWQWARNSSRRPTPA